ncbi:MAG: hydrogenase maturation nickel metallochaperone HypA [Ignavibacteria bacterium CG22_combo_CG10-13_8_21_14_all_37_15]|nr:hydrogenase maturation nickel metallochaperone HypA [Ignavibacteria bacterium]OIO13534.1 MAG: hydrogenase maturation nickel metallochaperone HypA [Ignavibacteria bacterium CG1_02_37_35]PIP78135.1 MAG: hydrogenase maturation nickel metallochaperone HypA [Ignavibacteria bacterium CG22_combo_CG10-13_8_21_14_all_37_15]PIS44981.1 MAG: hydrogenase maturation nickel metallochaperone HypA [Ignavibacteria bacterium CG08_land_8_20_14_0_20_37_9]PIX92911.1 MAG: hydrogenase maturation nickel metallochape
MHELSLAQEIISITEQYYSSDNNERVKSIKVKIGKLQNVLPDSLEFCFNALIQNSKMENAKMMIEHVPIKLECKNCGNISEQDGYLFACPKCGCSAITVISGNELTVSEIEFENVSNNKEVLN